MILLFILILFLMKDNQDIALKKYFLRRELTLRILLLKKIPLLALGVELDSQLKQ